MSRNCNKNCYTNSNSYDYSDEEFAYTKSMNYYQHPQNCAEYFHNALNTLFCGCFKKFFNPSTFTLYTENAYTAIDATTIKSLPLCNNTLIEYSDNSDLHYASLCTLTAFSFILKNAPTNLNNLVCAIKNHRSTCNYSTYSACNSDKAERLCSSLDCVSLYVAGSVGYLKDVTVLDVIDNAVWVAEPFTAPASPPTAGIRIYVICLNDIQLLS